MPAPSAQGDDHATYRLCSSQAATHAPHTSQAASGDSSLLDSDLVALGECKDAIMFDISSDHEDDRHMDGDSIWHSQPDRMVSGLCPAGVDSDADAAVVEHCLAHGGASRADRHIDGPW